MPQLTPEEKEQARLLQIAIVALGNAQEAFPVKSDLWIHLGDTYGDIEGIKTDIEEGNLIAEGNYL